jgi:hypothetical protein
LAFQYFHLWTYLMRAKLNIYFLYLGWKVFWIYLQLNCLSYIFLEWVKVKRCVISKSTSVTNQNTKNISDVHLLVIHNHRTLRLSNHNSDSIGDSVLIGQIQKSYSKVVTLMTGVLKISFNDNLYRENKSECKIII